MSFRQLLREPMLHFFLLAGVLFLIEQAFTASQKTQIVIDVRTADFLVKQREDLELRVLSPEERADTIDAYVEDEILYTEAYRRGLDRGDSRMRRNLILKMRGLLTGDLAPPTEKQLQQFFEENRERFARKESLTLDHVFFEDITVVPEDLLISLNEGLDPASVGSDAFELRRRMPNMTAKYIAGTFGANAAREIMDIGDEYWHGPFESARGVHFVRVVERFPAQQASFEDVERYLEGDWLMQQSRKAIREEVDRLRDGYEILLESDTGA